MTQYIPNAEVDSRMDNALEALRRYGGRPHDDEFIEILEELAELNDDLCHMRHQSVIAERIEKLCVLIAAIRWKSAERTWTRL